MTERLMLLDTAALYFRAFYGVPDTVRAPDGTPINAVRGLLDIIARLVGEFQPTELIACWDDDWRPQWRVDLIPSYKAHRVAEVVPGGSDIEETPDPLETQIPVIRAALDGLGIAVVGAPNYEADDVIGSLATQATVPVDIVTSDRDLFQLVDDESGVRVIYTAKGMSQLEVISDAVISTKYGISPRQYADFAALRGDASDGLPGVSGIGEKTAANLLREHGDLNHVIAASVDRSSSMSSAVRARLTTAAAYLEVAPQVVEVVRDLDLGDIGARILPVEGDRLQAVNRLGAEWGLGGSLERVIRAMGER